MEVQIELNRRFGIDLVHIFRKYKMQRIKKNDLYKLL